MIELNEEELAAHWQETVVAKRKELDRARRELDAVLEWAVRNNKSYTLLGDLMNQSKAAVRIKALRNGWDVERRTSRTSRV